jgi:tRNA (cmo5U34)-methyltransferase
MQDKKHVWQEQDSAQKFLEEIRGAIPLEAEQFDIISRIVRKLAPNIERLLDLGCGDGILGRTVLAAQPYAKGMFVDFSEHMIAAARQKADPHRATFIIQDLGEKDWAHSVQNHAPFDLILSGLAIHHLPDQKKQAVYKDIYDLLKPGGLFLHLEHVSSKSSWATDIFDELFIDYMWKYHRQQGGQKTRDEIAREFLDRHSRNTDIVATVDLQCRWLEEIGFVDVDCFFKLFELALFGGRKAE